MMILLDDLPLYVGYAATVAVALAVVGSLALLVRSWWRNQR
jgi:hypothetical protein